MKTYHAPASGTLVRWKSALLPGFEICYCDEVAFDGRQRFVFDRFTITLVEKGNGSFARGRSTIDGVAHGSITVSSPGDALAADGTSTCRNLYLTPALIEALSADAGSPRAYLSTFSSMRPGTRQNFDALLRATHALDGAPFELARQTQLLVALRAFVTGGVEDGWTARGERRAVRRVRELLLDRLDENLSLDELADVAGLNKFHLLRVFRSETGLPPHAYQLHARIGRARTLMGEGVTAFDAGIDTGFTDQSHFARFFKQLVGLTPNQYAFNLAGRKVNLEQSGRRPSLV